MALGIIKPWHTGMCYVLPVVIVHSLKIACMQALMLAASVDGVAAIQLLLKHGATIELQVRLSLHNSSVPRPKLPSSPSLDALLTSWLHALSPHNILYAFQDNAATHTIQQQLTSH